MRNLLFAAFILGILAGMVSAADCRVQFDVPQFNSSSSVCDNSQIWLNAVNNVSGSGIQVTVSLCNASGGCASAVQSTIQVPVGAGAKYYLAVQRRQNGNAYVWSNYTVNGTNFSVSLAAICPSLSGCSLNLRVLDNTRGTYSNSSYYTFGDPNIGCATPYIAQSHFRNSTLANATFTPQNLTSLQTWNCTVTATTDLGTTAVRYLNSTYAAASTANFAIATEVPNETMIMGSAICYLSNGTKLPVIREGCEGGIYSPVNCAGDTWVWSYVPTAYSLRSFTLQRTFTALPAYPVDEQTTFTNTNSSFGFRVVSQYSLKDAPVMAMRITTTNLPAGCQANNPNFTIMAPQYVCRMKHAGSGLILGGAEYGGYDYCEYLPWGYYNCSAPANITIQVETFNGDVWGGLDSTKIMTNNSINLQFVDAGCVIDDIQQYNSSSGLINIAAHVKQGYTSHPISANCNVTATGAWANITLGANTQYGHWENADGTQGDRMFSYIDTGTTGLPFNSSDTYFSHITVTCGSGTTTFVPGSPAVNGTRATWYNASWVKSRQYNVSGLTTGGQVRIPVSPLDISSDGTDLRVTTSSGGAETLANFWRSDGTDGDTAWSTGTRSGDVWVYVPTGTTSVYLYWNTGMADASSAAGVFYFYEPCNANSSWTIISGTMGVTGGKCYFSAYAGGFGDARTTAYQTNATYTVEWQMNGTVSGPTNLWTGIAASADTGKYNTNLNAYLVAYTDANGVSSSVYKEASVTYTLLHTFAAVGSQLTNYQFKANATVIKTTNLNTSATNSTTNNSYRAGYLHLIAGNDSSARWDNTRVREYYLVEPTFTEGGIATYGEYTPATNDSYSTTNYSSCSASKSFTNNYGKYSVVARCPVILDCRKQGIVHNEAAEYIIPYAAGAQETDPVTVRCDLIPLYDYASTFCFRSELYGPTYVNGVMVGPNKGNFDLPQDWNLANNTIHVFGLVKQSMQFSPPTCTSEVDYMQPANRIVPVMYASGGVVAAETWQTANMTYNQVTGAMGTCDDYVNIFPGSKNIFARIFMQEAPYLSGSDVITHVAYYMTDQVQMYALPYDEWQVGELTLRIVEPANVSWVDQGADLVAQLTINCIDCQEPDIKCYVGTNTSSARLRSSYPVIPVEIGNGTKRWDCFMMNFSSTADHFNNRTENQSVWCYAAIRRTDGAQIDRASNVLPVRIAPQTDPEHEIADIWGGIGDLGAWFGGGIVGFVLNAFMSNPVGFVVIAICMVIGAPYILLIMWTVLVVPRLPGNN